MEIEARKVILNRWNIPRILFKEWRDKEWWYSGVHDPVSEVYISWYFIRVNLADMFVFSVFDPKLNSPLHFKKQMFYLDRQRTPDSKRLSLTYSGSDVQISFSGDEPSGRWDLDFKSRDCSAKIQIERRIPWFTKFDNPIIENYALIHFFQNRVLGNVTAGARSYQIKDALGYQDHCYGTVPRRTGWHWIAVQNENIGLASLVNYGAFAQLYTQVYLAKATGAPRTEEWIRLEQSVSFESSISFDHPDYLKWKTPWIITSTDLDLTASVLQVVTDKTRIPIGIPFIVSLDHTEAYVCVEGRIRVDGEWIQTGKMYGVMEEHHGKW